MGIVCGRIDASKTYTHCVFTAPGFLVETARRQGLD